MHGTNPDQNASEAKSMIRTEVPENITACVWIRTYSGFMMENFLGLTPAEVQLLENYEFKTTYHFSVFILLESQCKTYD